MYVVYGIELGIVYVSFWISILCIYRVWFVRFDIMIFKFIFEFFVVFIYIGFFFSLLMLFLNVYCL